MLFFTFLGMSLLANAQATCTQTFTVSGQDDDPTVLTINAADLTCNGAGAITGLQLVNAAGTFTNGNCSTASAGWYSFNLSVDGGASTQVCAAEINGTDITGFTSLTITSQDNDSWSDGITLTIDVEVTFTPTVPPNCDAVLTSPANGDTAASVDGILIWSPASGGATGYNLTVGTTPGGNDVLNTTDVGNVITYNIGVLAQTTQHYITIEPYNALGAATGCTEQTFTTYTPIPGDVCGIALPIACGGSETGSTAAATTNGAQSIDCGTADTNAPGVWYNFTGTGDVVLASLCASGYDTKLQIYEGDCSTLTCVGGNDDSCGLQSEVQFISSVGTEYYIYVFGFGTSTGNYQLDLTCTPAPPIPSNDDCAGAINLPVSNSFNCTVPVSGTVYGASASTEGTPSCTFGQETDDVWYTFTAANDEHVINFQNVLGDDEINFSVYEGACGALTEVFCSFNNNSDLVPNLTVGNVYYVRVYSTSTTILSNTTFQICVLTPTPPITTDNTTYTVDELVEDVLVDAECVSISNITSGDHSAGSADTGIGYFTDGGSGFPFEAGIVLSSGAAINAAGPFTGTGPSGGFGGAGDTDLETVAGLAPGSTNDGVFVQFDFVPNTASMSFNFLMASSEYNGPGGSFQCNFSDSFAFILTRPDGTVENLAVLPASDNANTSITVTNIHPEVENNCAAVNEQYFGGYTITGAELSYDGRTVPFTASATVTPGDTYTIKMVIADEGDSIVDTAVFLEAGSFSANVDIDLNVNVGANGEVVICPGDTVNEVLTADGNFNGSETYEWQFNGVVIDGETTNTFTATQLGEYTVSVDQNGCGASDSVTFVEADLNIPNVPDMVQTDDDFDGFMPFNIDVNTPLFLGLNPNYVVSYHASQADADNNVNPLTSPYTNISNPQNIYVRVEDPVSGCITYTSFALIVLVEADCLVVDAGLDQDIDCSTDSCVDLTVTYTSAGESTSSYDVTTLDPVSPFPYSGLANPISVGTDDVWSDPAITIPFDFSFFENVYSELLVGSNGVLTFDTAVGTHINGDGVSDFNDNCEWSIDAAATIPSATFPYDPATFDSDFDTPILNAIFGVFHDIDPSDGGEIAWELIGNAPCRAMVISFNTVAQFGSSCPDPTTSQIVLWETTNIIDVYVPTKPLCTDWNDGLATLGIQNGDGTVGFTPPNRNTGAWTATDEAWRFTPNGGSTGGGANNNTIVTWYEGGTPIGNTDTVTVCPSVTTTYVAEVTYLNTDGTTTTVNDTVVVNVDPFVPTVDLGNDVSLCNATDYTITSNTNGTSTLTYEWQLDGVTIDGETNDSITVTQSGDYTLIATDESGCSAQDVVNITLIDEVTADLGADFDICTGTTQVVTVATNAGPGATYEWTQDGVVMAGDTTDNILVSTAGTYAVTITVGTCTGTASVVVTESASMTMDLGNDISVCEGSTVTLTANSNIGSAGIAYTWYQDGGIINGENGQTLTVVAAGTYEVSGVSGSCSATDTVDVSFVPPSFTAIIPDVEICQGETTVLDATPTGNTGNATYVWQQDGTVIDGETSATLTVGTPGVYTVTITADLCDLVLNINITEKLDCVIPNGISPNNDGTNDTLDLSFLSNYVIETFKVYNRYGSLVYEFNNYTNEFGGVANAGIMDGGDLPVGTYYFVADLGTTHPDYGDQIIQWVYINREK